MVNSRLLEKRIADSGKKIGHLAMMMGISTQYFGMKRRGVADFTNRETNILCNELGIVDLEEKEQIFFAKDVDINGNTMRQKEEKDGKHEAGR